MTPARARRAPAAAAKAAQKPTGKAARKTAPKAAKPAGTAKAPKAAKPEPKAARPPKATKPAPKAAKGRGRAAAAAQAPAKTKRAAKAAPPPAPAAANGAHAPHHAGPHQPPHHAGQPAAGGRPPARGVQTVKFSFYRVVDDVRAAPADERAALGRELRTLLDRSAQRMLTRVYSTVGTRGDTDFLVWQVHDDLSAIMDWHAELLGSDLGWALTRPHSYLSMTMRSLYTNELHAGSQGRDRLRPDGGQDDYLFVYPMAKTRAWYTLGHTERQRIMDEHIAIGHRYHGIKINTTYSYGLDDQEFVVAFEGNDPGEFLALVRELRDSESSSYTLFDTPMFTCRRVDSAGLLEQIGLASR